MNRPIGHSAAVSRTTPRSLMISVKEPSPRWSAWRAAVSDPTSTGVPVAASRARRTPASSNASRIAATRNRAAMPVSGPPAARPASSAASLSSGSTAPPGKTYAPAAKTDRRLRRSMNTCRSGASRISSTVAASRGSTRSFYGGQISCGWPLRQNRAPSYAGVVTDPRRALPAVDGVLDSLDGLPHGLLVQCARGALDEARRRASEGDEVDDGAVIDDARQRVARLRDGLLQPVVNATGVLVHTNLGRAPLSGEALAAAANVGRGYSNLEYRLDEGRRGSRHEHAGALLAQACGAEAGIVVNNNAAAVLPALGAVARGREVIVSRGELVEIGGGFRVPEIMAESGCRLVEVGTTNRTRIQDYERELCAETALLLK